MDKLECCKDNHSTRKNDNSSLNTTENERIHELTNIQLFMKPVTSKMDVGKRPTTSYE